MGSFCDFTSSIIWTEVIVPSPLCFLVPVLPYSLAWHPANHWKQRNRKKKPLKGVVFLLKLFLPTLDPFSKTTNPPMPHLSYVSSYCQLEEALKSCWSFFFLKVNSWKCFTACPRGVQLQSVIIILCIGHCFLIFSAYKCWDFNWIFKQQAMFYFTPPIFFNLEPH